ncbi:16S rRNA (cytidine(1402)-2'-O)-methyltransferase [Paenibacillus pasadenensis]|uniref:16S rRNA (cytidine(1402)-2'-O)-methyltransferase n=1 Tax=Paenibacillus pasadenensis TaxID=217090 RepID=UPI00203CA7FF|nr:16S rRNA (cytidine(1402)-2'-O)-methyltransferase [Paenibacillus pasadenensis]MCM3750024.1 16S rRNA (cytidine(1402)-2'-O)-methyltransferase [Paenibacillus pasadenensis]
MQVQKSFADHDKGMLYLVATPIGNLEDMTMRAIRILKEVSMIAAEDTRQTRKLLSRFEIENRLVSYHEHNKAASGPELLRLMEEGSSIALVSDAGMPAISDPGADLVREAAERGIPVVPVPGANAALSALIMSGLPTDRFTFAGFPPRDKKHFDKWLQELKSLPGTLLLYESPHRINKTLPILLNVLGDREIAMVRELTKRHEEAVRGRISECMAHLEEHEPLGEYCLVIGAGEAAETEPGSGWWELLRLEEHVEHYERLGSDRKEAIKQAAADRGLSKRDVYNEVMRK